MLFKQANALDLFRAHFRWLLLEDSWLQSSEQVLQSLNVLVDSDVMVGRRVSETRFSVMEVYKRGPHDGLIRSVTGVWKAEVQHFEPTSSPIVSVRRMNIQKSVLKAVMVVRTVINISVACSSEINFHFFLRHQVQIIMSISIVIPLIMVTSIPLSEHKNLVTYMSSAFCLTTIHSKILLKNRYLEWERLSFHLLRSTCSV